MARSRRKPSELPLETTRTIEFETDEGSWLSLDVSPDGSTILFELLGSLYTIPMAGGAARRITRGLGFDSQPRYSPDGSSIVFVSDRNGGDNLWIADADGGGMHLLLGDAAEKSDSYTSPAWTPDGEYVVATKGEVWETHKLWIWHRDGGSGAQLVPGSWDLNVQGPAFGPDGRFVHFARRYGAFSYNMTELDWQLAVYDRELGRSTVITAEVGGAVRPVLSPDGRWLVYGTRHEAETALRLRDLRSGDERWLAYPVQRDDQESRFLRDLMPGSCFTPDSRYLVTSYGGKIWKIPVAPGLPPDAEEIPFTVHVQAELGPRLFFESSVPDGPVEVRQVRSPVLSPDGSRLAFTAFDRLWIQDFPRGTPRRATDRPEGEYAPAWSPDGRRLAYASWSEEGGRLFVLDVEDGGDNGGDGDDGGWDGGDDRAEDGAAPGSPRALTEEHAYYDLPTWSPDGKCVVFVRGPRHPRIMERGTRGRELHQVPAAGGTSKRIMPLFGPGRPHFTDDPERIFIYEGGAAGLISVRLDGSDRRYHVRVVGVKESGGNRALPASEILMAPHGRTALALVHHHLYQVVVPSLGDHGPRISVEDPEKARFPVRRLTREGGEYPGWHDGGNAAFWAIGSTFFLCPLFPSRLGPSNRIREHGVRIVAPRDRPQGTLVLRGARIITMKGDEVIPEGDLVVRDHRIDSVGPAGRIELPPDATVMDLAGKTLMPGLVDIHAHLRPPFGLHKSQVWAYLANLAYGVTTTRDPQTTTTDVLTYADLVETGEILGPRIFATGPGMFPDEDVRSLAEARNLLRRYNEHFRVRTVKQYLTGNREQRQWIIMAAREEELMPTTEGALDMKLDLTQIFDGYTGQEHTFPIIPLYRDVVELVARSGLFYTPALLVSYGGPWGDNYFLTRERVHDDPKLRRFTPHHELDRRALRLSAWFEDSQHVFARMAAVARDIVRAGGRVCLGSHGQLQGLGAHWELRALQSGGMTEHETLRCATLFGAEALGCREDLGSLEAGKLADLLVLDEDPLENIRNSGAIRHVMKNGRLYEGDTLDEIWPRKHTLEGLWWWEQEPDDLPGLRQERRKRQGRD